MCLWMSVVRTLREEEEVEWVGAYVTYVPLIVKLFDEDGVTVKATYIFN